MRPFKIFESIERSIYQTVNAAAQAATTKVPANRLGSLHIPLSSRRAGADPAANSSGNPSNNADEPKAGIRLVKLLRDQANNFFLSTTHLTDGKGGFTSDERLTTAQGKAENYQSAYRTSTHEQREHFESQSARGIRPVGENNYRSMIDYRAATKVHVASLTDSEQAHDSMLTNIKCLTGTLVDAGLVDKICPDAKPANFDLSRIRSYGEKNWYSLVGVPNEATGSLGYVSRSITKPFVEKGLAHFKQAIEKRGLTPKEAMESLEMLLRKDRGFGHETQFRAGQALLLFRHCYSHEDNWGKGVTDVLIREGWIRQEEVDKIDSSRPAHEHDLSKGLLRRNMSVMGPIFHDTYVQFHRLFFGNDSETTKDLIHPDVAALRYQPIAHVKVNEEFTAFEDCSGLGDSFTAFKTTACVNHARMMSGEKRLSKDDVVAIIAALNAVYDNAGGARHSLREIARGCFVGAGYAVEDADSFYRSVCGDASIEHYAGRALVSWDGIRVQMDE